MSDDVHSTISSLWSCSYHIVEEYKGEIKKIVRIVTEQKERRIEGERGEYILYLVISQGHEQALVISSMKDK